MPFFLDLGHANIGDGDPLALFIQFHQRIVGMSFSNNDGLRDQHLGLHQGTIDYKKIIHAILTKQWRGLVAFETRGKHPGSSIVELIAIYQQVQHDNIKRAI